MAVSCTTLWDNDDIAESYSKPPSSCQSSDVAHTGILPASLLGAYAIDIGKSSHYYRSTGFYRWILHGSRSNFETLVISNLLVPG